MRRLKKSGVPLRDLIATATVLTAATIAMGVRRILRHRRFDCRRRRRAQSANYGAPGRLPAGFAIATSSDYGIDVDAKEAIAFAILAHETWRRRPSNLPSATGAKRAVVLGSIRTEIRPAFPLSHSRLSFLRCRLLGHLLADPH